MTEKRFTGVYIKDGLVELGDNGIVKLCPNERLEELLNELSNENEQLKKEYVAVRQQNSRLKQAVSGYEDTAKVANRLTRELEKNNMKVLAVKRKGDLL